MFYWIYDIPTWQLGALFGLLFVGGGVLMAIIGVIKSMMNKGS